MTAVVVLMVMPLKQTVFQQSCSLCYCERHKFLTVLKIDFNCVFVTCLNRLGIAVL